jgi:hypothetical protein
MQLRLESWPEAVSLKPIDLAEVTIRVKVNFAEAGAAIETADDMVKVNFARTNTVKTVAVVKGIWANVLWS